MLPQFVVLKAADADKLGDSTKGSAARFARIEATLQYWRGERAERLRNLDRKG
ncbi:hypothetical protein CCP3SC5AM1_1050002 [Gammaproteobacteria bacterium]